MSGGSRLGRPLMDSFRPNPHPDVFPGVSIKLGPFWGVHRAVRLVDRATPWPDEFEGLVFTVTDPEPERPRTEAPLSPARQAAVLARLALVSRALDLRIELAFERGLGVTLFPDGRVEPVDAREKLRQAGEDRELALRRITRREAARHERCRPALEALGGAEGASTGDAPHGEQP